MTPSTPKAGVVLKSKIDREHLKELIEGAGSKAFCVDQGVYYVNVDAPPETLLRALELAVQIKQRDGLWPFWWKFRVSRPER